MFQMNRFFQKIKAKDYPDQVDTSKNNNKENTNIQVLQAWNKIYMKSVFSISNYPIPIKAPKISTKVPVKQALEPMPNSNQHSNNFVIENQQQHLKAKISSYVSNDAIKNSSITNPINEKASSKTTLARAVMQEPIKNPGRNKTNEKDDEFFDKMCEKVFETYQ